MQWWQSLGWDNQEILKNQCRELAAPIYNEDLFAQEMAKMREEREAYQDSVEVLPDG